MLNKYRKGILWVVSAPSGAGKSTLCKHLLDTFPNEIVFSRSCTTRSIRPNENPDSYYFLSEKEFLKKKEQGDFLEWAEVHGNYYGTLIETVKENLSENKVVLLDIDVQGAIQVRENFKDAVFVFILPPSLDVLLKRLEKRSTDSKDTINLRLENAKKEIQSLEYYDYIVINDQLDQSKKEIEAVFQASTYQNKFYQKSFLQTLIQGANQ